MPSSDQAAARLAVHVLRAVLPRPVRVYPDRTTVVGHPGTYDDAGAAALLAAMAKPLECRASEAGGILHVHVQPLRHRGANALGSDKADPGLVSEPLREAVRKSGCEQILVVGREQSAHPATLSTLERFERDYLVLGHYFVTGDRPGPRDGKGIAWVLVYNPSESSTRVRRFESG